MISQMLNSSEKTGQEVKILPLTICLFEVHLFSEETVKMLLMQMILPVTVHMFSENNEEDIAMINETSIRSGTIIMNI